MRVFGSAATIRPFASCIRVEVFACVRPKREFKMTGEFIPNYSLALQLNRVPHLDVE